VNADWAKHNAPQLDDDTSAYVRTQSALYHRQLALRTIHDILLAID
jgi:hypothetical protein